MNINNEELARTLIKDSIIYHAKIYGVEGLIEKVESVYSECPVLKKLFLEEINKFLCKKS